MDTDTPTPSEPMLASSTASSAGALRAQLSAAGVVASYVLMVIMNAFASTGTPLVEFTNAQIADSHPVYGLPSGYAFAIWGIIYALQACFVIFQALPASCGGGRNLHELAAIRPYAAALFLTNGSWLILFGRQAFWTALVVILLYLALLLSLYLTLKVNYVAQEVSWKMKLLVAAGFSINASWVAIASALQVQVNFLEEGWMPSADFVSALLLVSATAVAAAAYRFADPFAAAAAVWALAAIINNQAEESTFGCNSRICPPCKTPGLRICERQNSSPVAGRPNGWLDLHCDSFVAGATAIHCPVDKSSEVAVAAKVGMSFVLGGLVLGVARALVRSRSLHSERPPLASGAKSGSGSGSRTPPKAKARAEGEASETSPASAAATHSS